MTVGIMDGLTESQRELLALSVKTKSITQTTLENKSFANDAINDFRKLVQENLLKIEIKSNVLYLKPKEDLIPKLHFEFLNIPNSRRNELCEIIAADLFDRNQVIEALKILKESGNKRAFTNAMLENTIDIHSPESASVLLELAEGMLEDDQIDRFAQSSFRIIAHIWRSEYLIALQHIGTLEHDINSGKLVENFRCAVYLLKAITNHLMGRTHTALKEIEQFIKVVDSEAYIQETAVILGCKLYATCGLNSIDSEIADKALKLARTHLQASDTNSRYFKYQLIQIESIKYFCDGNINLAYEKALNAIQFASSENYTGNHGPLEALYIKASCEEEFLEHQVAKMTWEELVELAKKYNLPTWYCISTMRLKRCEFFFDLEIDLVDELRKIRKFYESLPYRNELDIVVDAEELSIVYRDGNLDRANILLSRIPSNPRIRTIANAISIMTGKVPRVDLPPLATARQRLFYLLAQANDPKISQNDLKEVVKEILKLSENFGWYKIICIQKPEIISMVLRIAAEGKSAYLEQLTSLINYLAETKFGKPINERVVLTKREREVLLLLAVGFDRREICKQMSLALNTLKTHQKNLYKKLQAQTRQEAISNAHKLGLLPK